MSTAPRTLEATAIITLITALIYAAGWSYAYQWYDRFDAPKTAWPLETVGPASEAMLQQILEQEGAEPTAEDLVGALNGLTVRIYQDGNYALAETVAREAMVLGEQELGPALLARLQPGGLRDR